MTKTRIRSESELARRGRDLKKVRDALDEAGVDYWLASGALLGAYRDGDFIRWDWDVEIDVRQEDLEERLGDLHGALARRRFQVRMPRGNKWRVGCRRRNGTPIGIWGFALQTDVDGTLHRRKLVSTFNVPLRFWETGAFVELRGELYQAHAPVADYLAWTYGPDWRTPVRSDKHSEYLSAGFRGDRFKE